MVARFLMLSSHVGANGYHLGQHRLRTFSSLLKTLLDGEVFDYNHNCISGYKGISTLLIPFLFHISPTFYSFFHKSLSDSFDIS